MCVVASLQDALVNLECILSRKGGGREERASLFLFDYFPSIVCALQEDLASETSGETLFFRRQMAEVCIYRVHQCATSDTFAFM